MINTLFVDTGGWITTTAILTEVLDGFAQHQLRHLSGVLHQALHRTSIVDVITVNRTIFEKGWNLYESRSDKEWGLADCISFILMQKRNVVAALAYDIHFAQAGFRPLLQEAP